MRLTRVGCSPEICRQARGDEAGPRSSLGVGVWVGAHGGTNMAMAALQMLLLQHSPGGHWHPQPMPTRSSRAHGHGGVWGPGYSCQGLSGP